MLVTKHTAKLGLFGRKIIVISIIFVLLFTDLGHFLSFHTLPKIPEAEAAVVPAIRVESFEQDVGADGSTFSLTNDVGATTSAFIRMNTGTRKSSAGPISSTANTAPNVGTVGLVLSDTATVTVERVDATVVKVMGEVWRYEGSAGGGNEFIVRDRVEVSLIGSSASVPISGISNVDDVIPFVTGYTVNDASENNWEAASIAAHMSDSGNLEVSRNNSGTAATVYVDVVEFTGSRWSVCHGFSGAHDTAEQTITLDTDSDGQGGSVCDVTDWSTATIIEATMEGDSSETGLSDTLALVRPGTNTTSVVFDLQQDTNARNDGQAWIHVLQNDDMVVNRASNADLAEGNGAPGTIAFPSGASSTAAFDTLSLEWFTDTSGVGTAHMRGGLHARITGETVYNDGDTVLDADYDSTVEGNFEADLTFASTPSGVVYEAGGTGTGSFVGYNNSGDFIIRAGNGASVAPTDAARIVITPTEFDFSNRTGTLSWNFLPDTESVNLSFDEDSDGSIDYSTSTTATAAWANWSGGDDGGVGTSNGNVAGSELTSGFDFNGTIDQLRFIQGGPSITHWIHRSGNTVGVEYGVVELTALPAVTETTFVTASGTQTATAQIPQTGVELGGSFVITENTATRNITSILFSESGSIDAANHLDNIGLYYDLDTTAPYDCASESFTSTSTENQFGSTDTNGFSGADGVVSYTDTVSISTTQTFCGYVVYDVTSGASDGQTVDISIADIVNDVTVTGGGIVGPQGVADQSGVTILQNAELTQIRYHWRNDDGSETTATSLTGGIEGVIGNGFQPGTVRRLRVEVSAEGSITSPEAQYRLQYGEKPASCAAITTWINVADEGGAWDTHDSTNLAFGENTTNIAIGTGGVSDEGTTFVGANAILDTGDKSLNTTLASGEFVELEYTVVPTINAIEGTTYCFRLVDETPDTTHSFRIPVTVQSAEVDADLINFPVFINLSDLGTHFFNNVKSDGADIRVTESDGTTEVAREVVAINTGSDTGELYFNATTLSSTTNTTFYIYYGSSDMNEYQASSTYGAYGVWDDNYLGVYHMVETSSGALNEFIDSSGEHNHGTGEGTVGVPTATTGFIGTGQDFVAANGQLIDLGAPARWTSIGTNSELTMSAWINLDDSAGDYAIVSQWNSGASGNLFWADNGGLAQGFCYYNGAYMPSDCQDQPGQTPGVWQHVLARYDGLAGGVYINSGATGAGQTATTFSQDAVNFAIGAINGDSTGRAFNGLIDEVRISDIDRGEAWITTEYSNQASSSDFYATSTHEVVRESAANIIYSIYPEANITADVTVTATGTQTSTMDDPSVDNFLGGAFTLIENTASRDVTGITLSASGTIDALNSIDQIRLYYDFDTSFPHNCASESFDNTEPQFGATSTGFSAANGTTTFSALETTSINTTQAMCVYVVLDITASSSNSETLDIFIASPNTDVSVSAGSVGPGTESGIEGVTTIQGPVRTLVHYHWRNDNGSETDATSASGDVEDVQITAVPQESTRRLRVAVSNEGALTSPATIYQLEYGTKVTSCAAVTNWNVVGVGSTTAWAMVDSPNLTHGADTTNIAVSQGGVTDENTFLASNSGVRDLTASSTAITLTNTEQLELEFAIEATTESGFDTEYCFRLSDNGADLEAYTTYAELRTREKRDFFIQQGVVTITGTSTTLFAGSDYTAPASTSLAFIRMTNTQITGAGNDVGTQSQAADDVTAYFENPNGIGSAVTIARPTGAGSNTRVAWEIIEFVGIARTDNEMKVRDVGTVTYGSTALFATGTAVSGVVDDSDVVVFITGQLNPDTSVNNYNEGISTSAWNSTSSVPVFQRGDNDSVAAELSYAVVEFTGANWSIQRSEHTYSSINPETQVITAVGSRERTFLHTQKRAGNGESGLHDMGHEVHLSSLGQITYQLQDTPDPVTNPSLHTSVAWVIENTQTGVGEMVVYRSNGTLAEGAAACGGAEPCLEIIDIGNGAGDPIDPTNTSIWSNNRSEGAGTAFPRPVIAARITATSTTQYEFWRSENGQQQVYRTEVVEWPIAEISIRQNYYRFYVNEDAQTPTDPWPVGAADLGENTSITVLDDPVGETEVVRIRMTLLINNTSLPAQSESYKLQFGVRDSTCSAVTTWTDVGAPGSGAIWRGFDNPTPTDGSALSATDPPTGGDTLISLTDRAGSYEESNNSTVNPYKIRVGEDVEYDWVIEHNGATEKTFYCFRMVESDGTELTGYNNYPTIRTSGYSPVVINWQWFDDEVNITPASSLAPENTAPTDVANDNLLKLRVRVDEIDGASSNNVKFKLQYSETPNFTGPIFDVTASSTCAENSLWCYADGGGVDNAIIPTAVLSGVDACASGIGIGCGTHNEATTTIGTFTHTALANTEFEFTLQHAGARTNATYYFRLFDISSDEAVIASSSQPSLVTEGAQLSLTFDGVAAAVVTEGVTTDVTTTASGISFGSVPVNAEVEAAHRLTVNTNATEGYKVYAFSRSELLDSYGTPIASTTGTNATPVAWSTGCSALAIGCFGYHAGDDTLEGSTRFSPDDTYAAFTDTPQEIMFSSVPAVSESSDVVYKIEINEAQPAGQYRSDIVYIATPVF